MRLSNPHVRAFANNAGHPTCLSRFTAGLGVFLVLLLAWLAADPSAHRALHADEHAGCAHAQGMGGGQTDDHGCVISKFAHGQIEALVAPIVSMAPLSVCVDSCIRADERARTAAPHLFPPGRGPPAA